MEALELLNDEYGHCGECHEVHYIPEMVAVDGYYYCKSCSRPTKRAVDGAESVRESGIYHVEWVDADTIRLTPRH